MLAAFNNGERARVRTTCELMPPQPVAEIETTSSSPKHVWSTANRIGSEGSIIELGFSRPAVAGIASACIDLQILTNDTRPEACFKVQSVRNAGEKW